MKLKPVVALALCTACRQGVFRRRLGMTGEKPVQLSFIICSEKEEALSGTDVLKVPLAAQLCVSSHTSGFS